jgi:hypothetical protein
MERQIARQKLAWEGLFYSVQRIDLLVVSVSGAGIYVCLETVKFLKEYEIDTHFSIQIAGVLFLTAIITNFISQIFGRKSNEQEYLKLEIEINSKGKPKRTEKCLLDEYEKYAQKFDRYTNLFNWASIITMFLGLVMVVTYFIFIF